MADRVGKQIGNYRIVNQIAWGAIARIYLAENTTTKDLVALEFLPSRTSKDLESFLAEARLTSELVHPHILRTLDFGVEDDSPFIVTAYAPRGSLRQREPRGSKVPLAIVVSYARQIADALQYVHDQGIIYRDVKPENMLLGRNDEVLLSDFGLAIKVHQTARDIVGTPAYMAPEQFQGRPERASDQYSLGVVVYEWLCSTPPFSGDVMQLMYQHLQVPPPSLREKVPSIPLKVEQVVLKALAKDPKQRFVTVQAFADALEQASKSAQSPFAAPSGSIVTKEQSPSGSLYVGASQQGSSKIEHPARFVIRGPNGEIVQDYPLEKPDVVIGRVSQNDINFPKDMLVSRIHATVHYEHGQYVLRDEGSVNGTRVNNQPLGQSTNWTLRDGDQIHIGNHELTFKAATSPPPNIDEGSLTVIKSYGGSAEVVATGVDVKKIVGTGSEPKVSLANSQDPIITLSLFAIARATLEEDNRAIVGKVYSVEAGISQRKLMPVERFEGEPFKLELRRSIRFLFLDILLHTSDNIELISYWHKQLQYDSHNPEPQLVAFRFRVVAPQRSSIAIDFNYESRWLRTIHLEFDAVEQSELTTISQER